MPKPNLEWKVLPHGPLAEIDTDLFVVEGQIPMPLVDLPRRMTIVRLKDLELLVWSAISLEESVMEQVEALGRLTWLVVPGDHHRLDAAAWKLRYPQLKVVTPPGARERTEKVVPVDSTEPDFKDAGVQLLDVPGTHDEEAALLLRRPGGSTLVLNDLVANIRHASGFGGWLLRTMGFAGDKAQIPKSTEMLLVDCKAELRAQLLRWAELDDLKRIIVSHGEVIEHDPRRVLKELAESLGD